MTSRQRVAAAQRTSVALRTRTLAAVWLLAAVSVSPLAAQTDYYNTSTGRPLRIEDALPVEFRAIELNFAPVRWERAPNATYRWSLDPEVAVGILPRTQIQVGVPLSFVDGQSTSVRGVAGLEVAVMHTLNAETSIPAFALSGDILLPVGSLAADAPYGTLKGILTRTTRTARVHANAQFTLGPTPGESDGEVADVEASRWLAGIAVDKALPLRSVLFSVEGFAEQPLDSSAELEWNAGAGARVQLSPRWAFDAGVGRRLTGERAWSVTFGSAYAVGIP
jgi:hypothetical protein